jgi:hypothetical protein
MAVGGGEAGWEAFVDTIIEWYGKDTYIDEKDRKTWIEEGYGARRRA